MAAASREKPGSNHAAYARQTWMAMLGLATFMVLYVLLGAWFVYTAWRLTFGMGTDTSDGVYLGWVAGAGAALLAAFMFKGLFFLRPGRMGEALEITAQEQPRLFEFLHRLADRVGAPRPHKVFISADVNASVFYDLSVLNLLFPSRKNLNIGLGLVNVLTLTEFKAVLAHEFGHFAQRAMAVGRWVYTAQQIAAHLVHRRDKLDKFLDGLSGVDLRVAWIGWLLRTIVWSVRSLVESAFRLVVLMQRALSREMEMQADLVAVAATGSDALIHALHKLQGGDDSWTRAVDFAFAQKHAGAVPRNLYALHGRLLERMGVVLNDPGYSSVPPVPETAPERHRLFQQEMAQPPRMWLSHPLNHEREANAKQQYVPAPLDNRSAWTLFDRHETLAERMTAEILGSAGEAPAPLEQSFAALDAYFDREHLKSQYRGIYFGRSVVRHAATVQELYGPPGSTQGSSLYPESLAHAMDRLRALADEISQLEALHAGRLQPAGGILRHRGKAIKAVALPQAIAQVRKEMRAVETELLAHDQLCRSRHRALAIAAGGGWDVYLHGLLAMLHYADHSEANLHDAQSILAARVHAETAAGKVGNAGMKRILADANLLQAVLAALGLQRGQVVLDDTLKARLKTEGWTAVVGDMELGTATAENLANWLNVVDDWVDLYAGALSTLRTHALDQLLACEADLAAGRVDTAAPAPSSVPPSYQTLLPGAERESKARLSWWSRFQVSDGLIPTLARVGVAGSIVAAVLGMGGMVGNASLIVYNGLNRPVQVQIGKARLDVPAHGHASMEVEANEPLHVETRTGQGQLIEAFDEKIPGSFSQVIYNVAGAAPLVGWYAVYGNESPRPEEPLGSPRWSTSGAEVLFTKPPESVRTKGGGAVRHVLSALDTEPPRDQLERVKNGAARQAMLLAHVRWDDTRSADILEWLSLGSRLPEFPPLLAARLAEAPQDLILLLLEQSMATEAQWAGMCQRHVAAAAAAPQNPDLAYAAARCSEEGDTRTQAYLEGQRRWPDHGWFAYSNGHLHAAEGRWSEASEALQKARSRLPALRDEISLDIARIVRLAQPDGGAKLMPGLAKDSRDLQAYLDIENGKGRDKEDVEHRAYRELAAGRPARAAELLKSGKTGEPRLLRLVAASDGVPDELIARAMALPPDAGLDRDTVWTTLALARRMGQDPNPYYRALREKSQESTDAAMVAFMVHVAQGDEPQTAEEALAGLSPALRGHAYAMGVVLLGNKAPPTWREAARKLLFATERPYFS